MARTRKPAGDQIVVKRVHLDLHPRVDGRFFYRYDVVHRLRDIRSAAVEVPPLSLYLAGGDGRQQIYGNRGRFGISMQFQRFKSSKVRLVVFCLV